MKTCIILPTCLLWRCDNPFYVAYATVMATDKNYTEFFLSQKEKGNEVVLDYSPKIPRGIPDLDFYQATIEALQPSKVILPGIDYDWKSTADLGKALISRLKKKLPLIEWVGLLEGRDNNSLKESYRNLPIGVSLVALPSSLEKLARREEIVRDLSIRERVVFLEIFGNPYEEVPPPTVSYFCTSFPVRLALDQRLLKEYLPAPPVLDFSIPKEEIDIHLVGAEIKEYLEILR